jgi:stage II sporulation protein P
LIKIIELKKIYKWIGLILTITLFVLSIKFYVYDITVEALSKDKNYEVQVEEKNIKKDILRAVFLKGIPAMEVTYKKEVVQKEYSPKLVFYKLLDINYKDPKAFLKVEGDILENSHEDMENYNDHNKKVVEPKIESEPTMKNEDENLAEEKTTTEEEGKKVKEPDETDEVKIVASPAKKPNKKLKIVSGKPNIFIYHTHATESYLPVDEGNFHSLKRDYTVRKVGEVLTNSLKDKGYNVVHDETLHDYPSYRESYTRALSTLKINMKKYPTANFIIDIHRDAGGSSEESRKNSYITIKGKKVAKFSMVVGTKNENYEDLMAFANYIKGKSDELYPGLCKKTIKKPYKFNEYNSDHYILIEIGNTQNNIEEATKGAYYVGKILDEVIKDIKE